MSEVIFRTLSPSREEFIKISKKSSYNIVPLSLDLGDDFITPIQLYSAIKNKTYSFLLESVEGEEKISRYSFVGFEPLYIVETEGYIIRIKDFIKKKIKSYQFECDPLEELKKIMKGFSVFTRKRIRFEGGFVGYLSYDNIRFFEPVLKKDNFNKGARSAFVFCKYLFIFDHIEKRLTLISFLPLKEYNYQALKTLYSEEKERLISLLRNISKNSRIKPLNFFRKKMVKFSSNFTPQEFKKRVKKAKEYIRRGDVIQVVISQKLTAKYTQEPFVIYRYLRVLNPSSYMYYLNFGKIKVIGSSPEMLVRCEKRRLFTRPIAGTRPRGGNEIEDKLLEKELLTDSKEKAEHLMLVDLGRNDLGRVSLKGKVEVPIFMKIEKFSHVMHIVSEVSAWLDKNRTSFDALRACFPAGTVSGAPKIRAMEIIDELEKEPRGLYSGCVGYFSFTGNLDTAIIIRTIILEEKKVSIQAGAGIVLDSIPQKEYFETLNKAKAQILAVELACNYKG